MRVLTVYVVLNQCKKKQIPRLKTTHVNRQLNGVQTAACIRYNKYGSLWWCRQYRFTYRRISCVVIGNRDPGPDDNAAVLTAYWVPWRKKFTILRGHKYKLYAAVSTYNATNVVVMKLWHCKYALVIICNLQYRRWNRTYI